MKTAIIGMTGFIALVGACWAYAGEGVAAVGSDVAAVTRSDEASVFVRPVVTAIAPGVIVYAQDGTRIGPVRAYTQRGEDILTIWVGRTEYAPGSIVIEDGRAVLVTAG